MYGLHRPFLLPVLTRVLLFLGGGVTITTYSKRGALWERSLANGPAAGLLRGGSWLAFKVETAGAFNDRSKRSLVAAINSSSYKRTAECVSFMPVMR